MAGGLYIIWLSETHYLEGRWREHLRLLKAGRHKNRHMQAGKDV